MPWLDPPESVAIGASTCGDLTPPIAFPYVSRAIVTGAVEVNSRRGAIGGGVPATTHRLSWWTAAFNTQWVPAVLTGNAHENPELGLVPALCIAVRLRTAPWPSPTSVPPMASP